MKKSLLGVLLLVGATASLLYWANMKAGSSSPKFFNEDFVKSENEKRTHYSYFLPNGLQVLLISDSTTKKAAASLDIAVGSGNNPPQTLGLAHYLEHMLFLGTKKYPQVDNFQEFIREHGGDYNAYTSYENTNYFFDIQSEYLDDTLDRFADFFIAPLFNPDFAERERNVVDSEYHLGLKDDGRRYYAVLQEVLNPDHPISRFSVGNKNTLKGDAQALREELIDFYRANYRPNLMKLVIYGKEPIDQLRQLAEKHFSRLTNEKGVAQLVNEPLFAPGSLPALLQFQPVQEKRYLDYYFPIEPQEENFRSKPAHYVEHLLDDRSPTSLYQLLKTRGWANDLGAALDFSLPEAALFNVYVGLTPTGENHIDEITRLLFQTVRKIEEEGIAEWRFNELRDRSHTRLKYKQQEPALSYARSLSRRMQKLPTTRILSNGLWNDYEPAKIKSILKDINPRNMLITYVSPQAKTSRTEKYYQVGYDLRPLTQEELQLYSQPMEDIALELPPPNKLISSDLSLLDYDWDLARPQQLDLTNMNAWYLFDKSFRTPSINMKVVIQPRNRRQTPKEVVYQQMLRRMINEQLNKINQAPGFAGYGGGVRSDYYGLRIELSGYNDKFAYWLNQFLTSFHNHDYSELDFARLKENYARSLKNSLTSSPPARIRDARYEALIKYNWDEEVYLAELEALSLERLREFAVNYFTDLSMRAFVAGNLAREDAENLLKEFSGYFDGHVSPLGKVSDREKLVRLNGRGPFLYRTSSVHSDSAIEILYQARGYDYDTRARTALLAQLLQPLFFQQLRTEQELGYRVVAYYTKMHELPAIAFQVQSNNQYSYVLNERIQTFVNQASDYLAEMADRDFEDYKQGIINELLEEPQRFNEMVGRYWHEIFHNLLDFNDREQAAAALARVSKEELLEYYQVFLDPANSITILTDNSLAKEGSEPLGEWIEDPIKFKERLLRI